MGGNGMDRGDSITLFGMSDIGTQCTQTGHRCLDVTVGGGAAKEGGAVGKGGAYKQAMGLRFGRNGTNGAMQFARVEGEVHIRGLS